MAETTDLLIRLRSDATGIVEGNRQAQRSFTEFNQALELAQKGLHAATSAFGVFARIIERGQDVSELSNAFKNLGGTADGLDKLRSSVQGLVSDTDLMRAANEALLSGLSAEQFEQIAKAADSLGDAVGVKTKDAMDQLTRAVNTGNERLLKQYGIVVDNKKAEEEFAKSIGLTADVLNEAGKKEAARIAILEKMEERVKRLGEGHLTAGDAVQRLGVVFDNTIDKVAEAANENEELAKALDDVGKNLAAVDWQPFIEAAVLAAKAIAEVLEQLNNFGRGLDIIFNKSAQAKIYNLDQSIAGLQSERGSQWSQWGRDSIDRQIAALVKQKEEIINNERAMVDFNATLDAMQGLYKGATGGIVDFNGKLVYNRDLFTDTGKAAKSAAEASQAALDQFKKDIEQDAFLIGQGMENALSLGINLGPTGAGRNIIVEPVNKSFQESVDFFSDLLTPMFEGQAANFEDIFLDAAKRVAIGFASQMLASFAASAGLVNIGQIASAGGLGQALAVSAGFTGGGVGGIGSFLGGAGAAAAAGGAAGGVPGVPVVLSGTPAANFGLGSLGATIPAIVAAVGAYFVGTNSFSGLEKLGKGDKLSFSEQAALALPTFGLSFASDFLGFGGDSEKSRERKARDAFIDQFTGGDASFQGVGGTIELTNQFETSGKFGGAGTALVDAFGQTLGGGGKLGDDITAIFEQAVTQGENFNEVIVNTLSLMDKFGLTAEDTKVQLAELFLDGKVTLEEFSVGIDNLNILAQEDLVGPNSVADAINIVTQNLDNPRVALKGLELAFKEMAELGIDTSAEVSAYLTDKFGPDIAQAFQDIMDAGIDTWQEVGEAGPEQLRVIFKELSPLQQVFEDTAEAAQELGNQNMDKLNGALRNVKSNADKARESLEKMNREAEKAASSGQDLNPSLNENGR